MRVKSYKPRSAAGMQRRASHRVYPRAVVRLSRWSGSVPPGFAATQPHHGLILMDEGRNAGLCMQERRLAQELAVEEVDEDFLYACFGEAVGAVHGDELAADALQLRERHGRGGELKRTLDIGDADLAAAFPWMVFLVGCDLGDDVGGGLVELVEVILLGGRFLRASAASDATSSQVRTRTVAW